jgi:Protein of Unknown function (DUF2784)
MIYRVAADAILILHLCFVLFVVFGGLLVLRWRWLLLPHLAAVGWGALVEFAGWICPLTPLENHFRAFGGAAPYSGDFIDHYVTRILYPSALTRSIQIALGLSVLLLNLGVYACLIAPRSLRGGRR